MHSNHAQSDLRPCLPASLNQSAQALAATNYSPALSGVTPDVLRTVRATRKDPNGSYGPRAARNALNPTTDPMRAAVERMRRRFPHLSYRECRDAKLAMLAKRPQGGLTYHTPSAR